LQLQVAQTIETAPIGLLAGRVQADPSLAMRLPSNEEVTDPQRWQRRLLFIMEAAVCGELDNQGIVEAVPPIAETQNVISIQHLGLALDRLWNPVVDEKLTGLYQDGTWQPVFERSQALLDDSPTECQSYAEYYRQVLHESSPSLVARFVGALYLAAISKKTQSRPRPDSLSVVRHSVGLVRRVGVRGFDAAVAMMADLEVGDRHQVVELDEANERLNFTQPLAVCPVGKEKQTVAEVEERAYHEGHDPIGCPAIKNGRIVERLAHRIVDEAEARKLLL
jgi:hypothetical protein